MNFHIFRWLVINIKLEITLWMFVTVVVAIDHLYLHIASQLSGGIETSLGVLAEPEAGLSSEADSVGVAVVDAA